MSKNRFYINIFISVILITATCFAFIYILTQTNRPATTIFLGLLIIIQTGRLIHYVDRTNRELAKFLIYLKENDTTVAFSRKNIERTFRGLFQSFDKIAESLQKAKIDKEQKNIYLKTIVDHVGTGVITFDQDGNIEMINKTAKSLLKTGDIHNIKSFDSVMKGFSDILFSLNVNEQKLIKLPVDNEILQLAIRSAIIKIEDKTLHIIAIQNIQNELDERELESWQKLIRGLRHEIMNSITPITTLTSAIKRCFKTGNRVKPFSEINEEIINDALASTEVIEERSKGLIEFVEKYKSLTDLPKLKLEKLNLNHLISQIEILLKEELTSRKILLESELQPKDLSISVDKKLMEQVFINLIKNSMQSIGNNGLIQIKSEKKDSKIIIQIIDNGPGISREILDNIFIPFFSTKEGGSGIGLNISQQIIKKHQGSMYVYSEPDKHTIFTISIPDTN